MSFHGPGPSGVPSPYAVHYSAYPTRFHGGIWTRPVFGFPWIQRNQSNFIPGRDITEVMNGVGFYVGDGIFKPPGYGGGVFDGNLNGLGDEASDYPWGTYSDTTKKLQQTTNVALAEKAHCPIAVDGKLGPATCGARLHLTALYAGEAVFAAPSTCKSFIYPRAKSQGCSATSAPAPSSMPSSPTAPPDAFVGAGMTASTKKALAFMGGGLAAVAAVYLLKKRSAKAAR
jgi:hypothetical protein